MNDNDNLQCSVCHIDYSVKRRDPRLLHCLHAICEQCLQKQGDPHQIVCKLCNTSNAGKGGTPTDFVRLNELILYMAKHNPDRLLCTNKADGRKGRMYCFECNHFLCDQCESFHSQLDTTRNHLSVYIGDLTAHPLTEWQTKQKCNAHPDYPVSFYCQEPQCRKLICLYCATKDHPGHTMLEIDEAYDIEKEKLKNLSLRLSSMITALKDIQSKRNKADEQKQKIRDTFDKIRSVVSQRHRHHQQILNYHYGEYEQSFDENMQTLQEKLAEVRRCYEKAMAFHADPTYQALEKSVSEGTGSPTLKSPDSDLVFVQVGLANLLQDIQTFGDLNTEKDESNC